MVGNAFRYSAEIQKAEKDANGDWIVEGIASNGAHDNEGESLDPKGLDYSYFLTKGFLKWEHDKSPRNYIGEPLEARVTPQGFYIKGRLYGHSPLAQEAVEAMESLAKSGAKRRLGFSVEGSVKERDPRNPARVLKAIIRNVALTFNPVNDTTWASLAKSLSGADALEFALDKAMDTVAGGDTIPESLEMDKPRKKKRRNTLRLLLDVLETNPDPDDMLGGALEAVAKGLSSRDALLLASHISQLQKNTAGGGYCMDDLKKALEESLADLEKALDFEDEEEEEIEDTDDDEEEEVDDEDEEADDESVEKSFQDTLLEDDTIEKALEVSDFLESLVGTLNDSLGGLQKSLGQSMTAQRTINQSLVDTLQTMAERMEAQENLIKSLQDTIASQPVGRKAVVNGRELQTLAKSMDAPQPQKLSKSQVIDLLVQGVEQGKIHPLEVTKFELSGKVSEQTLSQLGL